MFRIAALLMIVFLTYLTGYNQGANNNEKIMIEFDPRCKK